jgi:hypothetical protein
VTRIPACNAPMGDADITAEAIANAKTLTSSSTEPSCDDVMSDDGNELILKEMARKLCDAFDQYESARREGVSREVLTALIENIATVCTNALAQVNSAPITGGPIGKG